MPETTPYIIAAFMLGSLIAALLMRIHAQGILQRTMKGMQDRINALDTELARQQATADARLEAASTLTLKLHGELRDLTLDGSALRNERDEARLALRDSMAENRSLSEKLDTQKKETMELHQQSATTFENLANRIFEQKSEKFSELNKTQMKEMLEPLGKNISEFKAKVEEVYHHESKERFSLGERVKELAKLNETITQETRNLTRALKGESKTQGRWGEVILETILEKSGLRKGEEYIMEHQLFDAEGNPLRSEAKGRKMRPDAIIKYPDDRHVIIDSKVSLNAFIRFTEAEDEEERKTALAMHVTAMRNHIAELSSRSYDDYDKSLDFVMMFVPNEPAFIAGLQGDPDLWNHAYDKRILLISPTNLIAALKLIADLWKREQQNRNALAIAERGAKMFDKFVGFVQNLKEVGDQLEKVKNRYDDAYKQLSTGNDNLIQQATKLKELGLKNKKELPAGLSASADDLG